MTVEKNIVTNEQVKTEVERIGFTLMEERPLTDNPADWYLRVVLAYQDNARGREYAVWLFNGTRDTLNEGHYTLNLTTAQEKYDNKK